MTEKINIGFKAGNEVRASQANTKNKVIGREEIPCTLEKIRDKLFKSRLSNSQLIDALKSNDPVLRRKAIEFLKGVNLDLKTAKTLRPILKKAVREEDDWRASLEAAAISIKASPAPDRIKIIIPALLKRIRNKDNRDIVDSYKIVEELGGMGSDPDVAKAALASLKKALNDLDVETQGRAIMALGRMNPRAVKSVVPILIKKFNKDDRTKYDIDITLAKLASDPEANKLVMPFLIDIMDKSEEAHKGLYNGKILRAFNVVENMEPSLANAALPSLINAMKENDPTISAFGARALIKMGSADSKTQDRTVLILTKMLKIKEEHKNEAFYGQIAEALSKIGCPNTKKAIPVIINILNDKNGSNRAGAVRALGNICLSHPDMENMIVPALMNRLTDNEIEYVIEETREVLRSLSKLPKNQ